MSIRPVHLGAPAKEEFLEAARWYEERSPEKKQKFLADFEKALKLVGHYPLAWPIVFKHYRTCQLSRFPYQLVYLEGKRYLKVVAVMHMKQRPGYWKNRR